MTTQLLTEAGIETWILERLGAPLVVVELTQGQLAHAVESAKRWFAAKKGVAIERDLALVPNQQHYTLPEDVDQVMDLALPESALDLSLTLAPGYFLPDQSIPYHALAAPQSGGLYSSYTQSLQYIETAKRVLGIELDWSYDSTTRKLSIFPTPKGGGTARYTFKSRFFTVEQLRERDHDLVKRYALTVAKEILGRVRGKREVLGATGPVTLDGKDLLDESKAEREELDEEISQSGFPIGFFTG